MLPLKSIKVLDLTRILAGPFCSMLLGDMGADIIKIENTKGGDETRKWGPPFAGPDSVYFWSVNRNKRSVSVDFSTKKGKDIIKELSKRSDVLIENYIPNTLSKYGLDYDSLKKTSPNLIYCSITGFGQEGPLSLRPGFDVIAAGMGGLMSITGPTDGPPCRVGVAVTDMMTGLFAQTSILAALVNKLTNPQCGGCHIDCNLLSTQISMLFHVGANYLTKNIVAPAVGTGHQNVVPYQAFPTKDSRYFIVGAVNDVRFSNLCDLLKVPELALDPKFKTNAARVKNRGELCPLLENIFSSQPLQYWEDLFKTSVLPNGPVNNMMQAFTNPQVKFLSDTLVHSWVDSDGNDVSVPGFPIRCSDWASGRNPSKPPKYGQHTREVLSTILNYTDAQIRELESSKAIRSLK